MAEPPAASEPTSTPPQPSGLDAFARRFTDRFSAVVDRVMAPLTPPPSEESPQSDDPADWDPEMPFTPDSSGLYMLLSGVTLIQRGYDRSARWMEVAAIPEGGYLRGEDYGPGQRVLLDITLDADLPDYDVDVWFHQMTSWAMSETPLVLMGREGDIAVLVNPDAPAEWLPIPVS